MSRAAASVTIVGRAGTHPQVAVGSTGDRVSFRVVATERRFDKTADDWVDGDEFGVTVVCWKHLATAVLNTVRKGDPVIVDGRIATRRFEKNGATQYFTEVKADFVGLDVAKAGTRFTRIPMDPRESAERPDHVAGTVQEPAQAAGDLIADDLLAPQEGEGFRAPWDEGAGEPVERTEALV